MTCGIISAMRRQDKADRIRSILGELYPRPGVPLAHRDPYTLLVSVLLSAQCTDARVNAVTPALFARAHTAEAMAELSAEEIEEIIRPCGLAPAKAKNIRRLSEILDAEHGGDVPADLEALERLPGVGHKTASVVMVQGFGVPAFPVDTHIHRLAGRWGLSRAKTVEEVERDLKKLYPPDSWHDIHIQMILFGREHCPARGHDLTACPICSFAASKRRIRDEARKRQGRARPTRLGRARA